MYRLSCGEVWGGIQDKDLDACSGTVKASLYSASCDGGKGGDIYYLSVCESDLLTRIAIADVVGHGQSVSDVSQWLYNALKAHMNSNDCRTVLTELNTRASDRGFEALTTAAVVGVYAADHQAYFAYAGHHPVLISRQGQPWTSIDQPRNDDTLSQLPLGVDTNGTYTQDIFPVSTGDRLAMYTDGILEAQNQSGDQFGDQRLLDALNQATQPASKPLPQLKTQVIEAIRSHTGGSLAHDDVTLLVIEVT